MSDFIFHKNEQAKGTFARHYTASATEVRYAHDSLTKVVLDDGRLITGSCLGCGDSPCIRKDRSDFMLPGELKDFPGDPGIDVCPTGAINWDNEKSTAFVVAEDCIGCGLCISRCPYGAISLAKGLTARVESAALDGVVVHEQIKGDHPKVKRTGQIAAPNAPAARNFPEKINSLNDEKKRLLIRNFFNEVGLNASTRRRGDSNMRIDIIGVSGNQRPFVAEVESGKDALESPRALLEDVAVLHSRYGYRVDDIDPVSVLLSLPSSRSEYYQVIRDIEKVLNLRCRTIAVDALIDLLWNCQKIESFDENAFFTG